LKTGRSEDRGQFRRRFENHALLCRPNVETALGVGLRKQTRQNARNPTGAAVNCGTARVRALRALRV
jgi:hypothetical protein